MEELDVGVIVDLTAAPRKADMPEREPFMALLSDLLDTHVAGFPAAVLAGDTVPDVFRIGTALSPLHLHRRGGSVAVPCSLTVDGSVFILDDTVDYSSSDADDITAGVHKAPIGRLTVDYAGSDPDELLAAVNRAPIGVRDVAVYFTNATVGCDAALFATLRPRMLVHTEPFAQRQDGLWVEESDPDAVRAYPVRDAAELGCQIHPARWYLQLKGKKASNLMAPALPVCIRHFGDDHFVGYSVS